MHHPVELLRRRLQHHHPGAEAVGEEEVGRGRDLGAIEEVVHVLEDDGVRVEEDYLVVLDELPGPELGVRRAEAREHLVGARVGVHDGLDVAEAPTLIGEPRARGGADLRRHHHHHRLPGPARLERAAERLDPGQVTLAVAERGRVGFLHELAPRGHPHATCVPRPVDAPAHVRARRTALRAREGALVARRRAIGWRRAPCMEEEDMMRSHLAPIIAPVVAVAASWRPCRPTRAPRRRPPPPSALAGEGFALLGKEKGVKVYRREKRPGIELAGESELAASPDRVRRVFVDYASHPRWKKHLKRQPGPRARGDGLLDVYQRLDLPVLDDRDYTLHVAWGDDAACRWMRFAVASAAARRPCEGVVRVTRHEGGWRLEPVDGGEATRAVYRFYLDLGGIVPGVDGQGAGGERSRGAVRRHREAAPRLSLTLGHRAAALQPLRLGAFAAQHPVRDRRVDPHPLRGPDGARAHSSRWRSVRVHSSL